MNLVWPPRWATDIGDAYLIKNGERQDGYQNSLGSCLNKPIPPNVTWTPFPISSGVNNSLPGDPWLGDAFRIDMYFTDNPRNSIGAFRPGGLKRMLLWHGFKTGMSCVVPMDMTTRLREYNTTAVASLEGLEVRLAFVINMGRDKKGVFERVDQCAYIRLTADADQEGWAKRISNEEMCGRVNLDYFGSSTQTEAPGPEETESDKDSGVGRIMASSVLWMCSAAVGFAIWA